MAVERQKTYRATWADYNGAAMVLDIIDLETVSSVITPMTVGSDPLKTKRDDDESPLAPLRSGSGTIKLVGTYKFLDNLSISSGHRYRVRLTKDGEVVWVGWLKGEALSQSYASNASDFSLNVVDDIGALDTWKMTQKAMTVNGRPYNYEMNPEGISYILSEIFCHVDSVYSDPEAETADKITFEFPVEDVDESGTMWQLTSYLRRGVFFTDKDIDDTEDEDSSTKGEFFEAKSCKDALEMICTAMGWTVQSHGLRIVFSSPRGSGQKRVVTFQQLYEETLPTTSEDIGTAAPVPYGEHEMSQYAGVHKVSVKAEMNTPTDVLYSLEDLIEFSSDNGTTKGEGSYRDYFTVRSVNYESKSKFLSLQCYDMELKSSVTEPSSASDYVVTPRSSLPDDWLTKDKSGIYKASGAMYVGVAKVDSYMPSDEKIDYDLKLGFFFNCPYPGYSSSQYGWIHFIPQNDEAAPYPLVTMRGGIVAFDSGCLVLSADIANWYYDYIYPSWSIKSVPVSIRVGSKYWDSTTESWVAKKTVCYISVSKNEGAAIDNIKTLEMPYSGANGYIMPINTFLSGYVELSIYNAAAYKESETGQGTPRYGIFTTYAIYNLSLKYQNTDTESYLDAPNHYNYTRYIDGWEDNSEIATVEIHSSRDNQTSFGQLLVNDGGVYTPLEQVNGKRPEEWLLGKMAGFFGRSRKMIKVEAKTDMTIKPGDVYTDADGGKWSVLGDVETDWLKGKSTYYMVDLADEQ